MDECAIEKPCGQLCINLPGSYRCHCRTGFQLQQDGQSCRRNGEYAKREIQNKTLGRITLRKYAYFFPDTDENAFEARDLENDFHDMSTTKDPMSSHGMYICIIQSKINSTNFCFSMY